ncbi:P-loop containing nucleoside triphosphate hydrolase protein [Boletus coccyginus]|nr:P-loop containing nucleoside triphosphate hydrolase protein [Boletus coccyginus]
MPSQSLTGALLVLGKTDGLPWTLPTWQSITRIHGEPWETDDNASDDARSTHVKEWTTKVANNVKAFATRVWAKAAAKQDAYIVKKSNDNDTAGRQAWAGFVSRRSGQWGINRIIDEILESAGRSPSRVLREFGLNELPFADTAQIYEVQGQLAHRLFGDDAYAGTGAMLKPEIGKFVSEIKAFLKDLHKLAKLYTTYDNNDRKEQVERYLADMVEMLRAVRKEPGSENSDSKGRLELPKALRDALLNLATIDDVFAISQALLASIEDVEAAEADDRLELDLDARVDPDWKEGVEALANYMEDQLWQKLGLTGNKLPFFQDWTDPDGMIDPWSEEGQAWLNVTPARRQELKPRWHQLVGIYRQIERAFEGKPVLLMDGVGLGKTLQVLGAIACLAYYQQFFVTKGQFPGDFAGRTFETEDGNVPDLPNIIVCPVNLKQQWENEIKRFLRPSTFDILPYTGRLDSRSTWWKQLYSSSKQPQMQRIILASHSAIQDDSTAVFDTHAMKEKVGHALPGARYESVSPITVYGRQYTFVIMDEAHCARKHNGIHRAFRGLRERGTAVIAMTATPVTTKAQVSRASTAPSSAACSSGSATKILPELQATAVTREWMAKIRDRFSYHVIRRTIDSVDHAGQKLFGMTPYQEHVLKLEMYPEEMQMLRGFAKDLVKENPIASADTRKTDKTIKLDTLAKVILHHLEKDGRYPLTMHKDGQSLIPNPDGSEDNVDYDGCDRVVVYTAFPSSNQAILDILELYDVKAIELNGSMTLKKRQAALDDFRTSTRDNGHRVLILSNVGMDTTWSALDDEQLRGRIFRYPQQKQVHFYRLIALGTPDVFLNNISFDKGQLHSAFVGCADEISEWSFICFSLDVCMALIIKQRRGSL